MLSENDLNKMWDNFRLDGSQEALSLIYYEHFDYLYDFAIKYTPDHTLIEDCIQNVFGYILKKRKKLNPVSNLRFYLLQKNMKSLCRECLLHLFSPVSPLILFPEFRRGKPGFLPE